MTAIARRRTRHTIVGAVMALLLVAVASAMFGVGVVTLSNSREGEAVGVDERPRVQFPATPNAVLAVTDEAGRLASLVVLTLLPDGQGGSIVTVPVNADGTAGFGPERQALNDGFDAAALAEFVVRVEEMLSITVERAEVVDAAGLAAMLPEVETARLTLPNDVVDTSGGGGLIATAGPQTFTLSEMTDLLAAIDDEVEVDVSHPNDVAVWESLAQTAPVAVPPEAVPVDGVGNPVAPGTVGELLARLWQGEVNVRDLLIASLAETENPSGADVVLVDRRDSTLVFSQVSPGLVSTPNVGLTTRIVANFTDEQLASSGGRYDTTSELAVELIGRLLFLSANVVSVDTAPTGAPDVTIIEIADERLVQETIEAADTLFGGAEVRVAETVLAGVDVQVTLGMSYLEHELARAAAGTSDESVTDTSVTDSVQPEVTASINVPATVPGDG